MLSQPVEPMFITSLGLFGSTLDELLLTSPLSGSLLGPKRRRQAQIDRDEPLGLPSPLNFRRALTIFLLSGQQICYQRLDLWPSFKNLKKRLERLRFRVTIGPRPQQLAMKQIAPLRLSQRPL